MLPINRDLSTTNPTAETNTDAYALESRSRLHFLSSPIF
jgi:hypothetical protein